MSIHPDTGQPYWWDAEGAPDDLPDILAELLSPPEPKPKPPRKSTPSNPSDGETPADWFTRTAEWDDILKGWDLVDGDGEADGSLWKHPTATNDSSASIKHGCLFVYSPNSALKKVTSRRSRTATPSSTPTPSSSMTAT